MPKYKNDCNHDPDAFMGTVQLPGYGNGEEGDLYIYIDKTYDAVGESFRFCFRYGELGAYETGAASAIIGYRWFSNTKSGVKNA